MAASSVVEPRCRHRRSCGISFAPRSSSTKSSLPSSQTRKIGFRGTLVQTSVYPREVVKVATPVLSVSWNLAVQDSAGHRNFPASFDTVPIDDAPVGSGVLVRYGVRAKCCEYGGEVLRLVRSTSETRRLNFANHQLRLVSSVWDADVVCAGCRNRKGSPVGEGPS